MQVALNWLVAQGNVIPIPGAKNAEQAKEFAGAIGWSLADNEVAELRSLASEIKPVVGFPVEYLWTLQDSVCSIVKLESCYMILSDI